MMTQSVKPKLFIGSSTEGLDIARAIALRLADVAEVTVWKDNVFRPNDGNLEALLRSLNHFDFAVFVLSPDDDTLSRGKTQPSPRDNALFEFGLFLGRLDKKRCFAVASDDRDGQGGYTLKLPSDLHGVTVARYEKNRADGNWAAAVGNACTVIIDELRGLGPRPSLSGQTATSTEASKLTSPASHEDKATSKRASVLEMMGLEDDESVTVGEFPESSADWFHHTRFVSAFPGNRGVTEYADPKVCIERLQLLLRPPLQWAWQGGEHAASGATPIWWWRGSRNMPIRRVSTLGPEEVLLDYYELPIRRVVAVNSGAYWQSFVYIESESKHPTGLFPLTEAEWKSRMEIDGYVDEEVGLFESRYVTRSEYDDGFAVLDGNPRRIDGVQLRVRYLTPYNIVIAPQESPINNSHFDQRFEQLMNGILNGVTTVADLAQEICRLPRKYIRR